MTKEQLNEFFTILQGKCVHKWVCGIFENKYYNSDTCTKCGEIKKMRVRWCPEDHKFDDEPISPFGELSYPFRKWMEQEMPEMWEKYLKKIFNTVPAWNTRDGNAYTQAFNIQHDPNFLLAWMKDNRELWGWMECPEPKCNTGYYDEIGYKCLVCNGKNKIKTPALEWLERMEKENKK